MTPMTPGQRTRNLLGTVAAGALLGAVWGVVARVWMRFISTSPEFTWAGTAFILAIPTIIGALAGLVLVARRRRWRRAGLARAFGGGSMILLGAGAGIIMLPTLLFGTLAAARTDWPRWVRLPLAMFAIVPVAYAMAEVWVLSGELRAAAATFWYLVLVGAMILILRVSLAPMPRPAVAPSTAPARVPAAGSG